MQGQDKSSHILDLMFEPSFIPPSIHICVTVLHTQQGVADRFVRDVKEQVAIIMKNPKEKTTGKVSCFSQLAFMMWCWTLDWMSSYNLVYLKNSLR